MLYSPRYHWQLLRCTAWRICIDMMNGREFPTLREVMGLLLAHMEISVTLAESDYTIWMCSHEQIVVFWVEQQFQRYFLLRAFLRNIGLCNYYLIRYVESNFVGSGSPDGVCLFQPHVAGVSTSLLNIHVSCLLMFIWNCCHFLCRI